MAPQNQQPKEETTESKPPVKTNWKYLAIVVVLGLLVGGMLMYSLQGINKGKGECMITGCNGQICSDQEVITTCEAVPEDACYKNAKCERQQNGECSWTQTKELLQCLQDVKTKQTSIDTSDWQTYRNEEFGFEVR
ncbi:MAG: hypothetical protein AAB600_04030 [Patescibacteria group bacterium]